MKTGIIGLGAMGAHMARNLARHGLLHAVWNRTREKATALAGETGAIDADSPADLAAACELIITCVSRDEDVLQVIGDLATSIRPDSVVADTSTVSAETAMRAADILAARSAHFLDCPVSGGVEGARNASLAMMVGGDTAVLDKVRPALAALAGNILHIGPTGSGQACKAVNQFMRTDSVAISCSQSSQAVPNPTINGTAKVPDRIPRSCPPPYIIGSNRTLGAFRRTYNAPIPLGP